MDNGVSIRFRDGRDCQVKWGLDEAMEVRLVGEAVKGFWIWQGWIGDGIESKLSSYEYLII